MIEGVLTKNYVSSLLITYFLHELFLFFCLSIGFMNDSVNILGNFFVWMSLGLIVGVGVYLLDRRFNEGGLTATVISGMLGALLGGFVANLVFGAGIGSLDLTSALLVIVTALLIAVIPRLVRNDEKETFVKRYDLDGGGIVGRSMGAKSLVYYSQITPLSKKEKEKNFREAKKEADDVAGNNNPAVRQILNEIEYPVSKRDLVSYAEHEDVSGKVINTFENIPDHIYDNPTQIKDEIKKES